MRKFKKLTKYILLFLFFLIVLAVLGYSYNQYDAIWSYGYSYAISIGEIPYRDFTLLTTPLFPYVFSVGLRFISHDNIVFLIEQALLLTATFYFLFRILGKKGWLLLVIMIFPSLRVIIPTYNYLAFFLMVVVIYLEKEHKNDYLIGFVLGLILLTKQSIGVFMLVPTFILYVKDYKKILKRVFPIMVLMFLFLCYLIFTDSLLSFLDICIFGLFDFAENNGKILTIWFYLSLVLIFILLVFLRKDRKNTSIYYSLCAFSFFFPIFNGYHFSFFFVAVMISVIPFLPLPEDYVKKLSLCLVGFIFIIYFFVYDVFHTTVLKDIPNFKYYVVDEELKQEIYQVNKLYNKYKNNNKSPIFLGTQSVYFTIFNEERLDYFDVLLRGNYGYDGTNKMIEKVRNLHNQIFIINMDDYNSTLENDQFDKKIVDYVIKHSKKHDTWDNYYVYLKE